MLDLGVWIGLLMWIGLLLLVFFWIRQWFYLMDMSRSDFVGPYDKAIWAGLMIVGSVFGAFVFWLWRVRKRQDQEGDRMASDLARMIREMPPEKVPGPILKD